MFCWKCWHDDSRNKSRLLNLVALTVALLILAAQRLLISVAVFCASDDCDCLIFATDVSMIIIQIIFFYVSILCKQLYKYFSYHHNKDETRLRYDSFIPLWVNFGGRASLFTEEVICFLRDTESGGEVTTVFQELFWLTLFAELECLVDGSLRHRWYKYEMNDVTEGGGSLGSKDSKCPKQNWQLSCWSFATRRFRGSSRTEATDTGGQQQQRYVT